MSRYLTSFIATSWARSVITLFLQLGLFGPFVLETLDSSFFYVPLANEILLFALINSDKGGAMWMVYALMAALGSVLGVFLLDLVMRRAGEKGIERLVKPQRFAWLKQRMESHAGWVVFIASLLPPPFPFRVTMMTASALQSPRMTMLVAVFLGRLVRFGAEAALILYFGQRFLNYLHSETVEYVIYGFLVVAVVGSAISLYRLFRRN